MLDVTILPDAIRRRGPWSLPNLLTYGRILAIPALVAILFWPRDDWMRWIALGIYTAAAITDYLDGYIARAWSQQSAIGRMLDPIADKLLVAALLLMLVYTGQIEGWTLWAAIVILCREILVSGLREFLADYRRRRTASLVERLERAVLEGELRPDADAPALGDYYATVLHGLSVQARDGVSRRRLLATIPTAMLAIQAVAQ